MITLILFIAPVVVFIPAIVDYSQTETINESQIIQEENTETLHTYIDVTMVSVTNSQIEITVSDMDTGNSETTTIDYGDTHTFSFENGDIIIEAIEEISDNEALITATVDTQYGWGESERTMHDYMPILFIGPILVVVLSMFYMVIRSGSDS